MVPSVRAHRLAALAPFKGAKKTRVMGSIGKELAQDSTRWRWPHRCARSSSRDKSQLAERVCCQMTLAWSQALEVTASLRSLHSQGQKNRSLSTGHKIQSHGEYWQVTIAGQQRRLRWPHRCCPAVVTCPYSP